MTNPMRPQRPFKVWVKHRPKADEPTAFVYVAVLQSKETTWEAEQATLPEVRAFIQGVKAATTMLGHYIKEPRIPTIEEVATDCSVKTPTDPEEIQP